MAKQSEKSDNLDRDPSCEYPDPTPVHIPGKTDRPPPLSLREEMQRYVRQTISQMAKENRMETFEEADDFEVEEEPDLTTRYVVQEMTDPTGLSVTLDGKPTPEDLSSLETKGAEGAEGSEATETSSKREDQTAPQAAQQ